MTDMNRGYSGYSMSNRATQAYEDGEMPLSKWTKAEILERVSDILPDYPDEINRLSRATLISKFVSWSSWHHTSEYCNATDFYSFNSEMTAEDILATDWKGLLEEEKAERAERRAMRAPKEPVTYVTAKVEFTDWQGTRKHPKPVKVVEVVNYMSDEKLVRTSCGKKRLSSLTVLEEKRQKTCLAKNMK